MPDPGGKCPRHLKDIAEFVFRDQKRVRRLFRLPQALMELKTGIQLRLFSRNMNILADRRVILLNIPAQIDQRHFAPAVPVDIIRAFMHR